MKVLPSSFCHGHVSRDVKVGTYVTEQHYRPVIANCEAAAHRLVFQDACWHPIHACLVQYFRGGDAWFAPFAKVLVDQTAWSAAWNTTYLVAIGVLLLPAHIVLLMSPMHLAMAAASS